MASEETWDSENDENGFDEQEDDQEMDGGDPELPVDGDELYDEEADDKDAKWVERNIGSGRIEIDTTDIPEEALKDIPKEALHTDGKICCPLCFTLLSALTQQHTTYPGQYRALFVRNCRIDADVELRFKKQKKTKQRRKKKLDMEDEEMPVNSFEESSKILVESEHLYEKEAYHPVHCIRCDAKVGVIDEEEMYHFFNVLPSE
eukprot:TRINITY_DN2407_c0_g1_i2.p1 TRINITY_DN2407_c0_g1~~TRINITY_DN2407_c0_g1_i2.p1  ORF type:complete len:204 (+),score=45.89 TRINITY_DN2407_c0_g1_i2:42-653(+)